MRTNRKNRPRRGLSMAVGSCLALFLALPLASAVVWPVLSVPQGLDALLSRYAELGELNGAALVVKDGVVLLSKGYGYADVDERVANGPQTKFMIGSLSKQFTAVMVLKLVEMGRLSLDSTLADALPYYRKDTGARVTVRHLLDHTSGIPCFTRYEGEEVRACQTIREFVLEYCSRDLESEPGSRFRYSNGGYVMLGAVIEQATGLAYGEALRRYVLSPLGMSATGISRLGEPLAQAAKGYQRREGRIVGTEPVNPYLAFSAGGLHSTVSDIARWERVFYNDDVLPAPLRALMETAPAGAYSFGQRHDSRSLGADGEKQDVVFHGGRILGFNSLLLRVPRDRILIVLFNNTDSTRLETMAAGLLDILYGRPPRAPRRSLAEEFRAALGKKGVMETAEELRRIRRQEGTLNDPEPEEIQLNALGYEFLAGKRLGAALAVFAFAVEEFPASANAYDSLAEAQAAAGMTGQAIASYRKSLELNPANRNAEERVRVMLAEGKEDAREQGVENDVRP